MRCPAATSTKGKAFPYLLLATAADSYYQVHETCIVNGADRTEKAPGGGRGCDGKGC
jgi:hypothetical protein